MIRRCDKCFVTYDDAQLSTICPHTTAAGGCGVLCKVHDLFNCTMAHDEHILGAMVRGAISGEPDHDKDGLGLRDPLTPARLRGVRDYLRDHSYRMGGMPHQLLATLDAEVARLKGALQKALRLSGTTPAHEWDSTMKDIKDAIDG